MWHDSRLPSWLTTLQAFALVASPRLGLRQLMHLKSKWTMRGHFRHLHFDTFPMVSWGANFMFVCLFNQCFEYLGFSHECSSQSESGLGSHWVQSLALFTTCESVSLSNTLFWPYVPLHSTFTQELNSKVLTSRIWKRGGGYKILTQTDLKLGSRLSMKP